MRIALAVAAMLLLAGSARPDEGMWLLGSPPNKLLKQRHDFPMVLSTTAWAWKPALLIEWW
jgi:hypothetical protein